MGVFFAQFFRHKGESIALEVVCFKLNASNQTNGFASSIAT